MKSKLLPVFLFLQLFFWGCGNNTDQKAEVKSENDIDAARNFIQSALKGDYNKARSLIVNDSLNNQQLDVFERNYRDRMNPDDKRGYQNASIDIHSVKILNDSTTIVTYSNTYKKLDDSVKVIRVNNQWLVDLKFFYQNRDSAR